MIGYTMYRDDTGNYGKLNLWIGEVDKCSAAKDLADCVVAEYTDQSIPYAKQKVKDIRKHDGSDVWFHIPTYGYSLRLSYQFNRSGDTGRYWYGGHIEIGESIKDAAPALAFAQKLIKKMDPDAIGDPVSLLDALRKIKAVPMTWLDGDSRTLVQWHDTEAYAATYAIEGGAA